MIAAKPVCCLLEDDGSLCGACGRVPEPVEKEVKTGQRVQYEAEGPKLVMGGNRKEKVGHGGCRLWLDHGLDSLGSALEGPIPCHLALGWPGKRASAFCTALTWIKEKSVALTFHGPEQ